MRQINNVFTPHIIQIGNNGYRAHPIGHIVYGRRRIEISSASVAEHPYMHLAFTHGVYSDGADSPAAAAYALPSWQDVF